MITRKNLVVFVFIVLILVALISLFVYKNFHKVESYNLMVNGTVKEVKNGSILVEGLVRPLDIDNSSDEKKTIEFVITSKTILKKNTISATIDQIKSGEPFQPEIQTTIGSVSDLVEGIGIFEIKSKDNLFSTNKASAIEIGYIIHDFPSLPIQ